MKIRPVILCGGSGTRLWPKQKKHQAKQFIDFGGWSLIQKTLERIKKSVFDYPIISTNLKYLKYVRKSLKKNKIKKYKIVLEPAKKNTAPAIYLASKYVFSLDQNATIGVYPSDHFIKNRDYSKMIPKNLKSFKGHIIYGIVPNQAATDYGYIEVEDSTKKICTVGIFDIEKNEEKLFFPLDTVREKGYIYSISKERLQTEGDLHKTITSQIKEKSQDENVNVSFGVFSTDYKTDYGYVLAYSPNIQS